MIENIKKILAICKCEEYKIVETRTEAEELFLVKKDVDMTRSKDVHNFSVTVYKNFEEGNSKYKGSSTVNIHPTMSDEEITKVIEDALFAASFVKNEYYEILSASDKKVEDNKSKLFEDTLSQWMPKFVDALYKNDVEEKGGINSAEIFLNRNYKRIVNSKGVDVSYRSCSGMIEFITTWKETEEIEMYKMLNFSDYEPEFISKAVNKMIFLAKERANAKDTVASGKYKVVLSGEPVKEVLSYYVDKSRAAYVYNKISTAEIGEPIQGAEVKGDHVNLILDPKLENSSASAPVDEDGVALEKTQVIKDGKLLTYHGDLRNSYYLKTKPTGNIRNFIIAPGSKTIEEMKEEPYVELVTFSDFQMDSITGDFGGEIRLGWYFDGKTTTKITGGSLSGNIANIHGNFHLSKETQMEDNFCGPQAIEMYDVTIAGK